MKELFKRWISGFITISILFLIGCGSRIEGSRTDLMRYEPGDDSYAFLQSWTDIKCGKDQNVQHLASLWKRRDSIIPIPLPLPWLASAIERIGNHQFHWIDLSTSTGNDKDKNEVSGVDLETIQIIPGEFYLNSDRFLCYYHQIIVPGKTIDQILAASTPLLAHEVEESANEQFEAIRKGERHHLSWDEYRTKLLQKFTFQAEDKKSQLPNEDVIPLDGGSLIRLRNVTKHSSIKLSRQGELFSLILPLSADDCREVHATFELLRDTIQKSAADGKPIDLAEIALIQNLSLRTHDGAGLEFTVSMTKLLNAMNDSQQRRIENRKHAGEGSNTTREWTIKSLEKCGIPCNQARSVEEVFAKYLVK